MLVKVREVSLDAKHRRMQTLSSASIIWFRFMGISQPIDSRHPKSKGSDSISRGGRQGGRGNALKINFDKNVIKSYCWLKERIGFSASDLWSLKWQM